jgi:hypothetical protein
MRKEGCGTVKQLPMADAPPSDTQPAEAEVAPEAVPAPEDGAEPKVDAQAAPEGGAEAEVAPAKEPMGAAAEVA